MQEKHAEKVQYIGIFREILRLLPFIHHLQNDSLSPMMSRARPFRNSASLCPVSQASHSLFLYLCIPRNGSHHSGFIQLVFRRLPFSRFSFMRLGRAELFRFKYSLSARSEFSLKFVVLLGLSSDRHQTIVAHTIHIICTYWQLSRSLAHISKPSYASQL